MLEKTPESPLDSEGSKQSILREIKPEYSLEGLMLKLKLQYWQTDNTLEKSLMLAKIEGRKRGCQRMRRLNGITDAMNMNLGKLRKMVRDREAWRAAVHWGHKEWDMTGQLNNTHAKAMPVILNGCKTLGRFLAPLNGSFLSFKMGIIIFHS